MNQLRTKVKIGMGKDKHRTIENIGESIGASCHEVVLDSRPDLGAGHLGNSPTISSLNLHYSIGRNRGLRPAVLGLRNHWGLELSS